MKRVLAIITAVAMLASCYKSDLTSTTHPDKGKVVINKLLPDDATPPTGGYTIIFNGESYNTTTTTTALDVEVDPGEYYVYVHSNTTYLTVVDNTATDGTIIATADTDGTNVKSLSDHAYFGMQRVVVTADTVITSNISMAQISRDINFILQITEGDPDRISSITASLSGIANQWECVSDTMWGTATTINPSLTQGASIVKSTVDNDYITGSIRVLGINETEQILAIELTYSDGKSQKIVSDISAQLADANSDKSIDITLSGDINTPIESEQEGTITNWDQINGGSETVN